MCKVGPKSRFCASKLTFGHARVGILKTSWKMGNFGIWPHRRIWLLNMMREVRVITTENGGKIACVVCLSCFKLKSSLFLSFVPSSSMPEIVEPFCIVIAHKSAGTNILASSVPNTPWFLAMSPIFLYFFWKTTLACSKVDFDEQNRLVTPFYTCLRQCLTFDRATYFWSLAAD